MGSCSRDPLEGLKSMINSLKKISIAILILALLIGSTAGITEESKPRETIPVPIWLQPQYPNYFLVPREQLEKLIHDASMYEFVKDQKCTNPWFAFLSGYALGVGSSILVNRTTR